MKKYHIDFAEGNTGEFEFTVVQAKEILDSVTNIGPVTLYATTYAKSKYGDCILGHIIGITEIK